MFQYVMADILTRTVWGSLDPVGVNFGDPLQDAGQLSGTLAVSDASNLTTLRDLMDADRCAIYVIESETGVIVWPGHVIAYTWHRKDNTISIEARQASAWLSEVHMGTSALTKRWSAVDQFQIVREVVEYATTDPATPTIQLDGSLSGVTRTYTVEGQSFKPCYDIMNEVAAIDDGFDWAINARFGSDGLPQLYLAMFYPERTSGPQFNLISAPQAENILLDEWTVSTAERRSRIYALGEGSPPAQRQATVTAATVATSTQLLREKTSNFNGEKITANLTKQGNSELASLQDAQGTISVELIPGKVPTLSAYATGDRVSLTVRDAFLDVSLPSVRIVDRSVQDDDRSNVAKVTLTLDLNDYTPPE